MAQEEVLRLVARARADASPALRKIRENLAAVKEGSAGPRDATRHLKGMHEEATRGAVNLKKHYRELSEHLDRVTGRINEGLQPAFAGLGVKGLAATGAVAALGEAIRNFATRGNDLIGFARQARLSVETVRGMEGVASIFNVDPAAVRHSEQALTDAMYLFRRHKGEFYAYLKAQRPEDAAALAITPETIAGDEKALQIWLTMLEKIKKEHGDAAARAFSKDALGSDTFVDMINNGTAGLAAAIEKYNAAAGKIDATKGKAFAENLADFQAALEGLSNSAGEKLLPEITAGVHNLAEAIKEYGPGFSAGIVNAVHGLEDVVKDVWPQLKSAFDEMDPYVQKVGGWKTVFESLAVVRLTTFAGSVTGLATAVGAFGGALNLLPLATLAALAKFADDKKMLQLPEGTGPRDVLKFLDPGLADRLMPEGGQPAAPGSSAGPAGRPEHPHSEVPAYLRSRSPLFKRSSFTEGGGLMAAHSDFEEAITRGTAAGVVKGLNDFEGLKAMNAEGGGPAGLQQAALRTFGGTGGRGGAGGGGLGANPYATAKDSASVREHIDFIRKAATALGIDPNHAMAVTRSEGLGHPYGAGDKGTSFGDFQMHYANHIRGLSLGGLGDLFNKETRLDGRDPKNWRALDLYALKKMREQGNTPWHGYRGGKWDGIGAMPHGITLPDVRSLPAPGETSRNADQSRAIHRVHGTGELNVRVLAPRTTQVAASGSGLFKTVNLNRGYSMTEASEVA